MSRRIRNAIRRQNYWNALYRGRRASLGVAAGVLGPIFEDDATTFGYVDAYTLDRSDGASVWRSSRTSTNGPLDSGKHYAEIYATEDGFGTSIGQVGVIDPANYSQGTYIGTYAGVAAVQVPNGTGMTKWFNGSNAGTIFPSTSFDHRSTPYRILLAIDLDEGRMWVGHDSGGTPIWDGDPHGLASPTFTGLPSSVQLGISIFRYSTFELKYGDDQIHDAPSQFAPFTKS